MFFALNTKPQVKNPIKDVTEILLGGLTNNVYKNPEMASMVVSVESLSDEKKTHLGNVGNTLETTIREAFSTTGLSLEGREHLAAAGVWAGMLGTEPRVWMNKEPTVPSNATVIPYGEGTVKRHYSAEAYLENENKNSQAFSIVYNMLGSRQDEFCEAWYPTIVFNPNEVGITVSSKLLYTYNDFKRSVNGSAAKPMRKNVIRSYVDHTILHNEQTLAIPNIRKTGGSDDNSEYFLSTTLIDPVSRPVGGGIEVLTSPVLTGKDFGVLELSQTKELLASGLMDVSDVLDASITLDALYISFGDHIVKIDTKDTPNSHFTYTPTGNTRKMVLHYESTNFVLTEDTLDVKGNPITDYFTELANGRKIRFGVTASGNVVLDTAKGRLDGHTVFLTVVRDSQDKVISLSTLGPKFEAAKIVGWDYTVPRANVNMRQRGILLDTQEEVQILNVPYRSPISHIAPPQGPTNELDTNALQTIITATGIRTSNDGVTALIKRFDTLKAYQPVADDEGNLPETATISRYYVRHAVFETELKINETVDSLRSAERLQDIRSSVIEKIRYYANEMYQKSEYKAAATVLTGDASFRPTVIIGTDQKLYNYIFVDGDLRLLGDTFDVKLVYTLDERMKDTIYLSFIINDSSKNTKIDPLNFGNMFWSPELVTTMNVPRNGGISKEVTVTPRYAHVGHLPVMTKIKVSGLPETVEKKMPIYSKVVS